MKKLMFGMLLALSLPLAACTVEDDPRPARMASAGPQCFNVDRIDGFDPVDRDTVDVRISRTRVFRLELTGGCDEVNWAQRIAIRSRTGRFVCNHLDAELIVPSMIGPNRCVVTGMRALSQAEIDARHARPR